MPILCEPAADSEELLADLGSEVRTADDLSAAAKLLDSDPAENLVVIGPRAVTEEALGFASALRMVRPAVGVILVRDQTSVELLNQALQSGMREVVQTGDHAALAAACRRSRDVSWRILAGDHHRAEPGRRWMARSSPCSPPRAACGKTMLAINIGVVLAQRGATGSAWWTWTWLRATSRSACCSTRCGASPTRCAMAGHLDTTGAASLLTPYRPGLEMLLAPVDARRRGEDPAVAGGGTAGGTAHHVRLRRGGHPAASQRARADRAGRLGAPRAADHSRRAGAEEPPGRTGHAGHAVLSAGDPVGGAQPGRSQAAG